MCGERLNTMLGAYCMEMPNDGSDQSIAEEGMHGQG
jgi:hypothetical protein